mmetsp:Transcript_30850/g.29460  ORF Transcript_30850/g.29460 Transcript_30850/m.29460 type:complete len:233 (+) Transcript_30850:84-782(+)
MNKNSASKTIEPSLLRYLSLGFMHDKITDTVVHDILRESPQIEKLDLTYCEKLTEIGFNSLIRLIPGLTDLNLRRCSRNVTDGVLFNIAFLCPKLKALNLGFCNEISDQGVMKIAQCCQELEKLELYQCVKISDYSLYKIADFCLLLKCLNIAYCMLITPIAIQRVIVSCELLEDLDLSRCNSFDGDDLFDLLEVSHLNLRNLKIQRCPNINAKDCDNLRRRYPHLLIKDTF